MALPHDLQDLKHRSSTIVYFSNSSETSLYTYTHVSHLDDKCYYLSYSVTAESSTSVSDLDWYFSLTWSFHYTACQDLICSFLEREKLDLMLFCQM